VLRGPYSCGTPLRYDHKLLEMIPPVVGETCRLVQRLTAPSSRYYVRVNTLRAEPGEVLDALREAGYGFRRDEEIPEALWAPVEGPLPFSLDGKRVVVDKKAAESVMTGSPLYAPGVLVAKGVVEGDPVTVYGPNGVPVAAGTALMSWKRVKPLIDAARREKRRARLGVFARIDEPMYRSPRAQDLPGWEQGLIYGQSLPSMYVARLLDPQPGETIIDMTAAPGGKVGHAAQLAGPEARIIAVDRPSKAARLRETLERLGLGWVEVLGADSRYLTRDYPSLAGSADKVILDPPCTNLGVIPKVDDRRTAKDAANLASYQWQMIREAHKLLRKGGILSYSVCTLTAVEAEAQAIRAVEELGFEPVEPPGWARRPLRTAAGLRFSPLLHGLTGFYIVLLRKR